MISAVGGHLLYYEGTHDGSPRTLIDSEALDAITVSRHGSLP
jgi:hypothetical protein